MTLLVHKCPRTDGAKEWYLRMPAEHPVVGCFSVDVPTRYKIYQEQCSRSNPPPKIFGLTRFIGKIAGDVQNSCTAAFRYAVLLWCIRRSELLEDSSCFAVPTKVARDIFTPLRSDRRRCTRSGRGIATSWILLPSVEIASHFLSMKYTTFSRL